MRKSPSTGRSVVVTTLISTFLLATVLYARLTTREEQALNTIVNNTDARVVVELLNDLSTGFTVIGVNALGTAFEENVLSRVASEIDVTHGAGTVMLGIVDPLAAAQGGTGLDTSASTGTPSADSGTGSGGDVHITGYTTANLPVTCTEGDQARVTDGDIPGIVVQCDDNDTWRWVLEYSRHIVNIAAPPYNARKANGNNATEIQAALDQCETLAIEDAGCTFFIPAGDYGTTEPLDFILTSQTTARVQFIGVPFSTNLACGYSDTTFQGACLQIICSPGACNRISWYGIGITGGGSNQPDYLLYCNGCAQATFSDFRFSNIRRYGFVCHICVNVMITRTICSNSNKVEVSGALCIFWENSNANISTINNMIEGPGSTDLSFIGFGLSAQRNVTVTNNVGERLWDFVSCGSIDDLENFTIANNAFTDIRNKGIACAPSGDFQEPINGTITGNALAADTSTGNCNRGAKGCVGIIVNSSTNVVIANNVIKNFERGIETTGIERHLLTANNLIENADTCIVNNQDPGKVVSDSRLGHYDICDSPDVQVYQTRGSGSVTGNVSVGPFYITGKVPSTVYNIASGDLIDPSDYLHLADQVQEETCTDNATPSSNAALAISPYAREIRVTQEDADGCDGSLTELAAHGQRFTLTVVDDNSGTAFNLTDGDPPRLAGNFAMGEYDSITAHFVTGVSGNDWAEISRSDN